MTTTTDWKEALVLCDFEAEKDGSVLLTMDAPHYLEMLNETFVLPMLVEEEKHEAGWFWRVSPKPL